MRYPAIVVCLVIAILGAATVVAPTLPLAFGASLIYALLPRRYSPA